MFDNKKKLKELEYEIDNLRDRVFNLEFAKERPLYDKICKARFKSKDKYLKQKYLILSSKSYKKLLDETRDLVYVRQEVREKIFGMEIFLDPTFDGDMYFRILEE